jgi:hypothetical protein
VKTPGGLGHFRPVWSLPFSVSMTTRQIRAMSPIDCFAWQYAFYAHLVHRKAPMTADQLTGLAQAVHALHGHLNPIAVADEVLLTAGIGLLISGSYYFTAPDWDVPISLIMAGFAPELRQLENWKTLDAQAAKYLLVPVLRE